ncbi:hypothetical protein J4412_01920 [Candidatus Pacearchaeota archaeon]|nr:MAG: hypothetical protein QJ16_C0019G0007 [archaeon GW2011_AR1]MBS3078241.1 hypothetical protein [Candidatus Pacearchaeota archaeon]HBD95043.1 hypothetical protein [Spirochaetia bacterium]HIH52114.1 hypothetical protein [Nanoarchaeota archaeon]
MDLEGTTEIPIGSKKIRFVGANHGFELVEAGIESSDFNLRKEEYKKEIRDSDLVLLEQPLEYFSNGKENIDFYKAEFFKNLGEIAYSEGKPVYVCDPINFKVYCFNLEMNNLLGDEKESISYDSKNKRLHKWRDLVIANHITETISKLDFEKAISIHGAKHNKGIIQNVLMPNSTKEELIKFRKFNEKGLMGIRRYTPSNSYEEISKYNQSWNKGILPLSK